MKIDTFIYLLLFLLSNHIAAQDMVWVKRMGGNHLDLCRAFALSRNENVYATGNFESTADFDPGIGVFNLISQGGSDIFVSKLDSNGNFIWAKSIGGALYNDISYNISVDSLENVYFCGFFANTVDFDPGPNIYNLTASGERSVFVCKLDSNGDFVWAKSFNTNTYSLNFYGRPYMAIDGAANVYVSDVFLGTVDMDPDTSVYNLTNNGLFVCKLNTMGQFVWAKKVQLGDCHGLAIDYQGDVYVTGNYLGVGPIDADPGPGVFNLTSSSYDNLYFLKLDSIGNFVWAKNIGVIQGSNSSAMSIDINKNVYITGYFRDFANFNTNGGGNMILSNGYVDAFILKLDSLGNFIWVRTVGGGGNDHARSITLDTMGNIYAVGTFSETVDFNPNNGIYSLTSNGSFDIFILKLDSLGNFSWARNMGGSDYDDGTGIAIGSNYSIYTAGFFRKTTNFDPNAGVYNLTAAGTSGDPDIFIHKMSQSPSTAITVINNTLDITLYPNPSTGLVYLEIAQDFRVAELSVINALGQVLREEQVYEKNSVLELPQEAGVYFVRVEVAGQVGVYKVVRE